MRRDAAPSDRSTVWPFSGQWMCVFRPCRSWLQPALRASTACTSQAVSSLCFGVHSGTTLHLAWSYIFLLTE